MMFGSFVQHFTAGVSALRFLGASDKRWSLIIGPPLAGSITVFNNNTVTSGNGFNLQPTFGYLEIRAGRHGYAVQHEWWVIADAAGRGFGFIETLASDCERLLMLIDELGERMDRQTGKAPTVDELRRKYGGPMVGR